MRKALAILLLFQSVLLFADYKQDYISLLDGKKYDTLKILLDKWINKEPENPEVYIAFFNYYLSKGRISGVAIESKPKGDQQIAITNPDSGEIVGYINDSNKYDGNDLKKAFEYISQGLSISQNRLDMHFGKIHLLGQIEDYHKQCDQMIKTLSISKINSNKWLWDNNKEIKDGKIFMLNNMQDYIITWIDDRSEESLQALKRCLKA